ncbi:MarR family winged helix-turn-helix transcriptional regulator [Nocardia sp. NBC_01009]|uniref:MarR family winged helix-turn-helix transcriptional regulator n=1 Tax=Nocardia sp. NBC_01009 TaxID=2975996 RepID=UPI00386C1960|nr:MarR family transcriptional regulator [Nocardia sp. NBC_01009]
MDDSTAPAVLEELARLVRRASQELDRAVATCLGETSVARWHVLTAVAAGTGRPMAHLGEATLLTGASLTRLIDAMIAENLVHRKVDDTDRRRVLVFPTRRGLLTHQTMTRAITEAGLDLIATDTGRLTGALTTMLDQLRDTEPAIL